MIPAPVHDGRRLDWFRRLDPRSLDHPMAAGPETPLPATGKVWTPGRTLDQGREGACVGFGVVDEAAAEPVPVPRLGAATARGVYHNAQRRDQWPGEAYDGTSVLAGCLEARARGWCAGFTWAKRAEQLAAGIVADGPAVVGVEWRDGCYRTDPLGVLRSSGDVVGGHCVCLLGFVPRGVLKAGTELDGQLLKTGLRAGVLSVLTTEEGAFVGQNSWGPAFGVGGLFVVGIGTVRAWARAGAEFAQPQQRQLPARRKGTAVASDVQYDEDEQPGEQPAGDTTLHIAAVDVLEGDRILDPPDELEQESVTVRGTPRHVRGWRGQRVVIDSTAGVFQLGASDPVTVRRVAG